MVKGRPRAVERGPPATTASTTTGGGGGGAVPEAPVFYPSDADFADPLAYIHRIRPLAEPYGICRIVPPPSWSPPAVLDPSVLSFPTKTQPIHRLLARPAPADPNTFLLDYRRFLGSSSRRRRKMKPPSLSDGRPLDLCRLFHAVKRFGGYDIACRGKRWGDVARLVGAGDGKNQVSECAKHVLAQLYYEHLYDYEQFINRLVSDGDGKQGNEGDCNVRERKRSNVDARKVAAAKSNARGQKRSNIDGQDATATQVSDGHNGKKGCLEARNVTVAPVSDGQNRKRSNLDAGEAATSVSGSQDQERSNLGARNRKGHDREPKNRKRSSLDGKRAVVTSARKRRKGKFDAQDGVVTVVNAALDQICEQCKSGLHGDVMLLCDRCDKGWHLYCLSPPLESVPPGNWYCSDCMSSDRDSFGFVTRKKSCSLEVFRRFDERVRRRLFGQRNVTRAQIEKQFWEIVEGRAGELEVMYGSDLDTSVYGSGFPRAGDLVPSSVEPEVWQHYCTSPWNLNNFPKLPGSILRTVQENIAGVMVPWLYIGMLFSSFCWHVEDHCFYSINYLHWGEPKCWYGVPGAEANAFEQVMRNALPDLFDAQPDLLFHLVTMLNPSILRANGVSVYSVVQEPGNFVITFPRSFHGGFNLGLNCAEAVNFAPADWLPHGGVGAELYRLYRKAPVLSHEELIYVVAKNGVDTKSLPYLKGEMERVFVREKRCREDLWINGIVKSRPMSPKNHPNFVGSEEDPTCIICQQYLYLSAVSCSCRPSSYVCLEHWKHLCECKPEKRRLLYRHTLAELGNLVHIGSPASKPSFAEENYQQHSFLPTKGCAKTKKVKVGCKSFVQHAEDWLSNSYHIIEIPFLDSAYDTAIEDAEQFLWGDHDMDSVRDMTSRLIEAKKWALSVRNCLSKIGDFLLHGDDHFDKVACTEIEELVSVNPVPCCEPSFTKLQAYAEEARKLVDQINAALSSRLTIGELEILQSRASEFPISLAETSVLASEVSSAKSWLKYASGCLAQNKPGVIEVDFLNKLKLEMAQLRIQLPEMDLLSDLWREAESWRMRCLEYLKGSPGVKELEDFVLEAVSVKFSIPELNLLKQYYSDSCSWVGQVDSILKGLHERDDHGNIVEELSAILKDGESLRVKTDELSSVEKELKRSLCRRQASEALTTRMPMEVIQDILKEASLLTIEEEQLFVEISEMLKKAISWEEKATSILQQSAHLSEFEDLIRCSEDIFAILPSASDVKSAISSSKLWMDKSQAYLRPVRCDKSACQGYLKVDSLKDLISESKRMNVIVDTAPALQAVLEEVDGWEHNALSVLQDSRTLLHTNEANFVTDSSVQKKLKELLEKINAAIGSGLSLGFELKVFPQLRDASLAFKWILNALSFCSKMPVLKEVDSSVEEVAHLPASLLDSPLVRRLIRGTSWLRKALILLPSPQISERHRLEDVENILVEYQEIAVPYPMMTSELQNAIKKHNSWIEQCDAFFMFSGQQSWARLLRLKENGQSDVFDCSEMDKVVFEIEKVEKWLSLCHNTLLSTTSDRSSLLSELSKIKRSLDKVSSLYSKSKDCMRNDFSVCCPYDLENEDVYRCIKCEDGYHISCVRPTTASAGMTNGYICPFCLCIESGDPLINGIRALMCKGNRPELSSLSELLFIADGFYSGIEELDLLEETVKQAQKCNSNLMQIVHHATSYKDEDLTPISQYLLFALKAVAVAGLYDQQVSCSVESAITRHSWKKRTMKLMHGAEKPFIQQILRLEKEGCTLGISSEDFYMHEVTKVRESSLQWLEKAKKVTSDSGELALNLVYELITEGENLSVHFEKELKLLRARSVLYCICRKPYDHRAMIACDQCDEWYHFDCINLHEPPPETFYCAACHPTNGEEFISLPRPVCCEDRSITEAEPHTPPVSGDELERKDLNKSNISLREKSQIRIDLIKLLRCHSEIDNLWRERKRVLHRTARRRSNFVGFF